MFSVFTSKVYKYYYVLAHSLIFSVNVYRNETVSATAVQYFFMYYG